MLATLDGRFVALHSADPDASGDHEISGGGYIRQPANLGAARNGERSNEVLPITFTDLPAATLSHFAIWDAPRGGVFLWGGVLEREASVAPGDSFRFDPMTLRLIVN